MSDNLLPCLKVRDWEGREHTTCRVLWPEKPSEFMPWLAFGWDHPHTFEFLNEDMLKTLGMTEAEVEAKALDNLRQRKSAWQSHDTPLGDGKTLKLLICTDDFLAAERILDAEFMKEAQRRLGAPAMLVGVPRRGVILATPFQTDTNVVLGFGGVVFGQFSRGESAPVSPMLFVVADGAILGFEESIAATLAAKKAEKGKTDDEDEDGVEDPQAPYVSAMTVKKEPATPAPARPATAVPKAGPAAPRPVSRPAMKRPAPPPPPAESNSSVWLTRAGAIIFIVLVLLGLLRMLLK